jgi:50S ribosomal protein L16 3-hydroxylase
MTAQPPPPLGVLTAAQFLRRYWQKRPLLVRAAFPGFRDPLTPRELARLACEGGVESRLVLERGQAGPWQVIEGPQDPRRLGRLPKTRWTLLVQGVDRQVPAVSDLLDHFRFLPGWRVDDVMVSVAPRLGSVGPHVDSYDVFLVQGRGRRRWRIATKTTADYRPGLDLRVLRRFCPEDEWVLEPGDMLYLPPGVAHHGVALEECLTYSIGFRAPSGVELAGGLLERLVRAPAPQARYRDPGLRVPRHSGEIPAVARRAMRRLLDAELGRVKGSGFDRLVGELLTEPRDAGRSPRSGRVRPRDLRVRLSRGAHLVRAAGSRFAFVRRGRSADLFVDGRHHGLPPPLAIAASLLADARRVANADLAPHLDRPGFLALLCDLLNRGALAIERPRPASRPGAGRKAPAGSRPGRGSR